MNFLAYLFDMDGLLLDTEKVFMELAVDMLGREGRPKDEVEAFFLTLVGSSNAMTIDRLTAYLGSPSRAEKFFRESLDLDR
ncbi:MAG: hypothetical protein AAF492_33545, partial [Verrucomicrobiota bacterium]